MVHLGKITGKVRPGQGRRPRSKLLSDKEVTQVVEKLLHSGLSQPQRIVVDCLGIAGVLNTRQLSELSGLKAGSIKRMAQLQLTMRLPYTARETSSHYERLGIPAGSGSIYTLDAVGGELFRRRHKKEAKGIDPGKPLPQLMNDILANEALIKFSQSALEKDYEVVWEHGTLFDTDGELWLEPTAMVTCRRAGFQSRTFLLQFNDQQYCIKAQQQLKAYGKAATSNFWQRQWPVSKFPTVLVLGYEGIEIETSDQLCMYSKPLKDLFTGEGWLTWKNTHTQQIESVLASDR